MRAAVALTAAAFALTACSGTKSIAATDAAITKFHGLLDAGRFDAIYAASASDMKSASAPAAFDALLAAVHRKLGAFKSGTRTGWNDNFTIGGEIVTIVYDSTYTGGRAQENFVFRMSGGQPQLAGYHINSDALILK